MKKIIFVLGLFLILFFDSNVYAVCDTADINRLKGIASNLEISYEHNVYGSLNEEDDMLMSVYNISVAGLTDEIYIVDGDGNEYHYYDKNQDGIINIETSSGERKIFVLSEMCVGTLLYTKTLNLPTFNFNSLSEECQKQEFKDLEICAEFIKEDEEIIQSDEFEEKIEEVKKERAGILYKIKNFLVENIIYVAIGVGVVAVMIIVLVLRHRKRSVLE